MQKEKNIIIKRTSNKLIFKAEKNTTLFEMKFHAIKNSELETLKEVLSDIQNLLNKIEISENKRKNKLSIKILWGLLTAMF